MIIMVVMIISFTGHNCNNLVKRFEKPMSRLYMTDTRDTAGTSIPGWVTPSMLLKGITYLLLQLRFSNLFRLQ